MTGLVLEVLNKGNVDVINLKDILTIMRQIWVVHIKECERKQKNTTSTQIIAQVLHTR